MATEPPDRIDDPAARLRHDLRNKLAGIRNATHYIRLRVARTDLPASDPRIEVFFKMIDDELVAADDLLSAPLGHGRTKAGLPVLLVDDEGAIRTTLGALLGGEGHEIVAVASLAEARAVLRARDDFVLALLDRNLEDGSGLELIDDLRARCPAARIFLCTGDLENDTDAARVDSVVDKVHVLDAALKALRAIAGRA